MSDQYEQQVQTVAIEEWPKVAGILNAELRDLDLAETCTQDAFTKALSEWPVDGVPQRPGAWLLTVARRSAIDKLRRNKLGGEKAQLLGQLESRTAPAAVAVEMSLVRDEQLQLIFSCCHPALSIENQLALTLRCVLGVTTKRIAQAFLTSETTLQQRLVRAKRKIADSAIPLAMPRDAELVERTQSVSHAIYLLYNEGYIASPNPDPTKRLGPEALRLATLFAELLPDEPEALGLCSLLHTLAGRAPARVVQGKLVLLQDQQRRLWNWPLIEKGKAFLDSALKLNQSGPYQLQAAINALHCIEDAQETDWQQIGLLYTKLIEFADTPVTRLNHAVAVAMADPNAGLKLLDDLEEPLASYHYFYSARAAIRNMAGKRDGAASDYVKALELCDNDLEQVLLQSKLSELTQS